MLYAYENMDIFAELASDKLKANALGAIKQKDWVIDYCFIYRERSITVSSVFAFFL